ncbi:hypothetical protein Tco_1547637 [Tanacetum coccineum]
MTGIMTELILRECMEKAQADYDSSLAKPKIDINAKIELSKEHLKELRNKAYIRLEKEDMIDHIANFLKYSIQLKFPINDEDDGPDYFEFVTWLNSRFKDHRRVDGMTKSALWHSWVKGEGNNELIDDIVSSDEEWEESDYGNPPNTDTDSFFKPYLEAQEKGDICLIEKEHHLNNHSSDVSVQNSASCFDDKKNDLINEKVCNAKKFELIKYSLGDNEEYIAISTRENNTWKKDKGWTMIHTKERAGEKSNLKTSL